MCILATYVAQVKNDTLNIILQQHITPNGNPHYLGPKNKM